MALNVPRYSPNDLRTIANEFLRRHHPDGTLPIPIEHIVELQYRIDIVPVPGLMLDFSVDAFLTNDLMEIRVDRSAFKRGGNRYRFSLAHEISHLELHREIIGELSFTNISGWKKSLAAFSEKEYFIIEWQAYVLAGLILVPPVPLANLFQEAMESAREAGISTTKRHSDARDLIEKQLANHFLVSRDVITRRIEADDLWKD